MKSITTVVKIIMKIIKSISQYSDDITVIKPVLNRKYLEKELFFGSLPDFQRKPLEEIINELSRRGVSILPIYAYTMATAYHETKRFKYREEIGRGNGKSYGKFVTIIAGKRERYYGRGWTQLTWIKNYVDMSIKCSMAFNEEINLVDDPDKVFKDDKINAFIICEGMFTGSFTGKKITDYINSTKTDFKNSRRVINGTDDADIIAGYAYKFLEALNEK